MDACHVFITRLEARNARNHEVTDREGSVGQLGWPDGPSRAASIHGVSAGNLPESLRVGVTHHGDEQRITSRHRKRATFTTSEKPEASIAVVPLARECAPSATAHALRPSR
jgi:hypothetical protein